MNNEEKIQELNDKIDLLTSQLNAEYLSEYQLKNLMYRIDNLTISRDVLQNKINREIPENNKNKRNIILHICYIIMIIYLLVLVSLIVSL